MKNHMINAPRGLPPQGADAPTASCKVPNGLPSDSCAERYEFPPPNIATLKALLRGHGYAEPFVDLIADGFAPREFQIGMTGGWKVRDAFFLVAFTSAFCFVRKKPLWLRLDQILAMIAETLDSRNTVLREQNDAINMVKWTQCTYSTGTFWWPTYIPPCTMSRDLLTTIRLCVLQTIWSSNPKALLPVDFSAGLVNFSNETCARLKMLIANAIQSRPAQPESETKSDTETFIDAGESALTAEVHRLLDALQNGPKSGRELQELLGVGRTVLLKRFLAPARNTGLVVPTEQGSSPNQRYRLVSEDETEGGKQAQPGGAGAARRR